MKGKDESAFYSKDDVECDVMVIYCPFDFIQDILLNVTLKIFALMHAVTILTC